MKLNEYYHRLIYQHVRWLYAALTSQSQPEEIYVYEPAAYFAKKLLQLCLAEKYIYVEPSNSPFFAPHNIVFSRNYGKAHVPFFKNSYTYLHSTEHSEDFIFFSNGWYFYFVSSCIFTTANGASANAEFIICFSGIRKNETYHNDVGTVMVIECSFNSAFYSLCFSTSCISAILVYRNCVNER